MNHAEYADEDLFEPEDIEAYCVRCRETVLVEHPQAVWTRKGMPATRGECSLCGGTVFRMGKTDAHRATERPQPVEFDKELGEHTTRRKPPQLTRETVYVNYAPDAADFAQTLATALENAGIAAWIAEHHAAESTEWATGMHPALKHCARMVYVLSAQAIDDAHVIADWTFFKAQKKPIVIAQTDAIAPPDAIRRSARFDFSKDYKTAFRQLLQALSS